MWKRRRIGDTEFIGRFSREELDAALAKMEIVDGPRYWERPLPDGRRQYGATIRRVNGPRFTEQYFPEGYDFGPCLQRGCTEHATTAWYCEAHRRS